MTVAPGASAALAGGVPPPGVDLRFFTPLTLHDRTERPITVDQTNVSVVVGEQAVVKWLRTPAPDRASRLLAHLAATGFTAMPGFHAAAFRDGALIALVTAYLPDAEDGWDWCTDAVLSWLAGGPPATVNPPSDNPPSYNPPAANPPSGSAAAFGPPLDQVAAFGPLLGRLAADLHAGLATPSVHFPHPLTPAAPLPPSTALADALETADDDWLRSISSQISDDISVLSGYVSPAPSINLHGDLHVGQILRWRGGYAVTDFDGHPTVAPAPEPAARDLAQLRTSVLHVAEIANRRTAGRHRATVLDWGRRTADDLLDAYRAGLAGHGLAHLLDERLLRPFEVEQECRELVYAARFLPRWRYAPMGVLRSWYR